MRTSLGLLLRLPIPGPQTEIGGVPPRVEADYEAVRRCWLPLR